MNDLISRQAAIDALGERPMVWTDDDQYMLGERSQYDRDRLAIGTLPPAQPEQRWIPCSERLPKPIAPSQRREWFITSNQYGGVTLTCYEFEASPFKEGWQTDMTILAWMPLPEPYKEKDNERT